MTLEQRGMQNRSGRPETRQSLTQPRSAFTKVGKTRTIMLGKQRMRGLARKKVSVSTRFSLSMTIDADKQSAGNIHSSNRRRHPQQEAEGRRDVMRENILLASCTFYMAKEIKLVGPTSRAKPKQILQIS